MQPPPSQPQGAMATGAAILTVPCSAGRSPKQSSQRRSSASLSVRASSDANSKLCEPRLFPFLFRNSSHGFTSAFRFAKIASPQR